jgi:hypothetical protein
MNASQFAGADYHYSDTEASFADHAAGEDRELANRERAERREEWAGRPPANERAERRALQQSEDHLRRGNDPAHVAFLERQAEEDKAFAKASEAKRLAKPGLTVTCPHCFAKPGQSCRGASVSQNNSHDDRRTVEGAVKAAANGTPYQDWRERPPAAERASAPEPTDTTRQEPDTNTTPPPPPKAPRKPRQPRATAAKTPQPAAPQPDSLTECDRTIETALRLYHLPAVLDAAWAADRRIHGRPAA